MLFVCMPLCVCCNLPPPPPEQPTPTGPHRAHITSSILFIFVGVSSIFRLPLCLQASHPVRLTRRSIPRVLDVSTRIASAQGLSLGSLIDLVLLVDPSILVTALLATTTVFVCFAGAALFSKRRSYLYLGGLLSSGLMGESNCCCFVVALFRWFS